jgi:hypothetical protein
MNTQNNRYWSAEFSGIIHELPLYEENNWCLVYDEHTACDDNNLQARTPESK